MTPNGPESLSGKQASGPSFCAFYPLCDVTRESVRKRSSPRA